MEERIYARLNLWDNELLDHLDLGIALFRVNQIGSPKDVKLDKNAKDPIAKARSEIKRTIQLLYCNTACVKQSGFTQEELLATPDVDRLRERVGHVTQEMAQVLWSNLVQDRPCNGIVNWKRPDQRQNRHTQCRTTNASPARQTSDLLN